MSDFGTETPKNANVSIARGLDAPPPYSALRPAGGGRMSCDEAELINSSEGLATKPRCLQPQNFHDHRDEKHTLHSSQLQKALYKHNESAAEELIFYHSGGSAEGAEVLTQTAASERRTGARRRVLWHDELVRGARCARCRGSILQRRRLESQAESPQARRAASVTEESDFSK